MSSPCKLDHETFSRYGSWLHGMPTFPHGTTHAKFSSAYMYESSCNGFSSKPTTFENAAAIGKGLLWTSPTSAECGIARSCPSLPRPDASCCYNALPIRGEFPLRSLIWDLRRLTNELQTLTTTDIQITSRLCHIDGAVALCKARGEPKTPIARELHSTVRGLMVS
jgi:hypothetical protein